MEIKIISAIYNENQDIKPIGSALFDEKGIVIICPNFGEGTIFLEWETGKTRCTICDYVK